MTDVPPDNAELEATLRANIAANPKDFRTLTQLASLLLDSGRTEESLVILNHVEALAPGYGAGFTLKIKTIFRDRFGPPPAARSVPAGKDVVSMPLLGKSGRFGNQLLQYGFLRLYAQTHALIALTPDWIGRDLFALDDPYPVPSLPSISERDADLFASLNGNGAVFANYQMNGFFCRHTSAWSNRTNSFRALFRPSPHIEPILQQALARLRGMGKTLVAIHIRRGDFGQGAFWIAPSGWYRAWLDRIWDRLDRPILYIASDDPQAASEFRRFGAVSAEALDVDLPGAEFYLDHYLLSQADHLAISNSTFSFTAAMLNETGQTFVRPDPVRKMLVAFAPWDAEVLLPPAP